MANPLPRSFALAETRRRYEATPRTLDDDLQRMARGDRGCLGDAIAGAGALGIFVFGVLGYLGFTGMAPTAVAAALLIAGFVLSSAAQVKSAPLRHRALTAGPLVLGRVLRTDRALYEPGETPYPALVLFAVDEPHRFDADYLRELAGKLESLQSGSAQPGHEAVQARLRDPERADIVELPATLSGPGHAFVGTISVDPRRLPARKIEADVVPVIVAPGLGFVEHV